MRVGGDRSAAIAALKPEHFLWSLKDGVGEITLPSHATYSEERDMVKACRRLGIRTRLVAKELARGNENERNNGKYEKIVLPTAAFEVPEDDSAEKTHSLQF